MLSLGYRVSALWLLNPVFGLLQLFAIAVIGTRIFSDKTGAVAVFFGVLSPFFLVNSIGMMSHAFCALLSIAACLALFIALATGKLWYYAGMFACLAAALQVRPYTGFVLALVLTSAALWLNRRNRTILLRVFFLGFIFGVIALASVLLYNHAYTGSWFVSPYAMAAGSSTPPELSFRLARIWQGIRQYAPQTAEESLIGAFPFLYLLAAHALVCERTSRKEVWILTAIYLALAGAYLAHPEGSGVLFGERFHFEGFFALLLLAARGSQLLFERWRNPRWAIVWILVLFTAAQVAQQSAAVATVVRRVEPYRKVREAIMTSGLAGLVFLHDNPGFVAKHFNLNDPDWRHASRIYLVDAEPALRDEWACRYGFAGWTVVTYDPKLKRATLLKSTSNCATLNRIPQ
jgi:4-amino-4-deoxy-L-arabinose transferase-like glycosyltransferase